MPIRTTDELFASTAFLTSNGVLRSMDPINALCVILDEDGLLRRGPTLQIMPHGIYAYGTRSENFLFMRGECTRMNAPLEDYTWDGPASGSAIEYGLRGVNGAKRALVYYAQASSIEFTDRLPTWEREIFAWADLEHGGLG